MYPSNLLNSETIEDCFERLTCTTIMNQYKMSMSKDSEDNGDSDAESDILISCDPTSSPEDIPVLTTMYKRVDKKIPCQELFLKQLK